VTRLKARLAHAQMFGPLIDLVVPGVFLFGHVRQQQFKHHLLGTHRTLAVGGDLHAFGRGAAARGGQHALAGDFDHTGAAIAGGLKTVLVAQVRDLDASALGDFEQGFACSGLHILAIELEADHLGLGG